MGVRCLVRDIDQLASALQVGVRRVCPARLEALSTWLGESAEKNCLVDSGTIDLMRRAGANPRSDVLPLDSAPAESCAYAEGSAGPILEALDLGSTDSILEWAEAAAHRQRLAPPTVLVKLFDLVPKYAEGLAPVLGTRARWLASLMDIELQAPASSIGQDIEGNWAELDWKERLARIVALQPVPKDEPILVQAASDRRKEVREAAVHLLVRLEGSQFARELTEVAKGRLKVQRKLLSRTLTMVPPAPEELPKSLPRTSSRAGFGPKALALYDLVRFTPPSLWEEETGLEPSDLLALAERSDHADAFIDGVHLAAAESFDDRRWCDVLLKHYAGKSHLEFWPALCARASDDAMEDVMRGLLKDPNRALESLTHRPGRLPPSLSRVVVELAKSLPHAGAKAFAGRLDLSILPMIGQPWPDASEPTRLHWHRVLDLRKRLLKSLDGEL